MKSNLDLVRNNFKLLRKRIKVKEKPCKISTKLVIPYGNPKNYTEKEYKSAFYRGFKNSTFSKAEIDDLYSFALSQLKSSFKSESKVIEKDEIFSEHSRSESSESELSELKSEPKIIEKDEIFFESSESDSESFEFESDSESE